MISDTVKLRERIVKYAAAGYARRDIASLVGITSSALRRHLVALGIAEEVAVREVMEKHRPHHRKTEGVLDGRSVAHQGPEVFEESDEA